jgi:hypothetical protein
VSAWIAPTAVVCGGVVIGPNKTQRLVKSAMAPARRLIGRRVTWAFGGLNHASQRLGRVFLILVVPIIELARLVASARARLAKTPGGVGWRGVRFDPEEWRVPPEPLRGLHRKTRAVAPQISVVQKASKSSNGWITSKASSGENHFDRISKPCSRKIFVAGCDAR